MLKIAHIATDEKFIECAVEIFESAYPQQNTFYIGSPKPWRYIKDKPIYKPLSKVRWLEILITKRSILKKYDIIVFHGLPTMWLIPMVLLKHRYVWLGWGYDYYSRSFDSGLLEGSLILPNTAVKENSHIKYKATSKSFSRNIANKIVGSKYFFKLAMRHLNVFSPVLPEEFQLVKMKYGLGKHTQYSPWNYGILEKHLAKDISSKDISSANSILLGNSATSTNNHFDALNSILDMNTTRTIYVPLSYGDMNYAKSVKDYIFNNPRLSSQCKVLDKFMPLNEYNSILNNCGFVIMNHVRQQAVANIVAMMYRGSKVFLREESILYKFFKGLGAHVYSVQELELDSTLLETHLSNYQIEENKKILQKNWSEDVIVQRTKNLVEKALH